MQEECPQPLRPHSSLGRSRASSSMTLPRGHLCRMLPAYIPHRHNCLRGCPPPGSPLQPSLLHCSFHRHHRWWRLRHNSKSRSRLSSRTFLSLHLHPASFLFLHSQCSQPCTSPCLGKPRCRQPSFPRSLRYAAGVSSLWSAVSWKTS